MTKRWLFSGWLGWVLVGLMLAVHMWDAERALWLNLLLGVAWFLWTGWILAYPFYAYGQVKGAAGKGDPTLIDTDKRTASSALERADRRRRRLAGLD